MRKYSVCLAVLFGILLVTPLSMAQMRVEDVTEDEDEEASAALAVLPLRFGTALCLDGVNDYATAPDAPSLDVGTGSTADFTIEAFFYVPDLNNTIDTLLWKQGAYGLYIIFSSSAPDLVVFRIWPDASLGRPNTLVTSIHLYVGWHHVAAVFNNEFTASQDLRALYVDGTRRAQSTSVELTPGIPNSSSALNIGAFAGVNPARGRIDEVRISNIVRYSQAAFPLPTTPFQRDDSTRALWHFGESPSSTVFRDASRNGNTLTGRNGAHTCSQ